MADTSDKVVVGVDPRSEKGKNACRRMRAAGRVPGNVYGMNLPAFSISVDPRRVEELLKLESGRNTLFTLSMAGGKDSRDVMIRELQRDPVTERLLHIDFVRIDPNRPVHVRVPVRLLGTPEGVKNEGGLVDFVHREVDVICLPAAIPEHFDVDIGALHIGQHVAVKDLQIGGDVQVEEDLETIVAVVAAPRAEVVAEEVEAEEVEEAEGEPEVIKKGKEGEEEAAGDAGEER